MSTCAILMVRDEADIIRYNILHLLDEVDRIVVADNLSTDGTARILNNLQRQYPDRVTVVDDPDPAYYQSRKMSALAVLAAEISGEESPWIVPVDADELWYWRGGRICDELENLEDANVVRAPLYNHFCTSLDNQTNNPFQRMIYRQHDPGALPKVAFRWNQHAVIAQGNHNVDLGIPVVEHVGGLELRHFPYRSLDHFIRKARNGAAAYKATDLPSSEGAHWREYGALYDRHGEQALRDVYEQWFYFMAPITAGMVLDPAPYLRWQQ